MQLAVNANHKTHKITVTYAVGLYCMTSDVTSTPGLFCAKETGSSRLVHAQFSQIIRAVSVHDIKLSITTESRSLMCEREWKLWNCPCPTLANYSGCFCLGLETMHINFVSPKLFAKETGNSRIVESVFFND